MSEPTQYRRRQFYINKDFQKRVMIYLALLVVVVIVVANGLALGYAKLLHTTGAGYFQPGVSLAGTSWAQTLDFLWLPGLITLILGIMFVLVFGLLYSHRIAGPLFNLKRMLQRVENGDLSAPMHIRSKDEFHDVEGAFNLMRAGLYQRVTQLHTAAAELPEPHRRRMIRLLHELFSTSSEDEKVTETVS